MPSPTKPNAPYAADVHGAPGPVQFSAEPRTTVSTPSPSEEPSSPSSPNDRTAVEEDQASVEALDLESSTAPREGGMSVGVPDSTTRGKVDPKTTARKKKRAPRKAPQAVRPTTPQLKIGKGKRVWVKRKHLNYCIDVDDPAYEIIQANKNGEFRFYGLCLGPCGKQIYKIRFDLLPTGHNEVAVPRKPIKLLEKGAEEPPYDPKLKVGEEVLEELHDAGGEIDGVDANANENENVKKKGKVNYEAESYKSFLELPQDAQAHAKSFDLKYGPNDEDVLQWSILGDTEQITKDEMDHGAAKKSPIKKDIDWKPDPNDNDYNAMLFDHFFPGVEGKAAVLDKYLNQPHCTMHRTVQNDKIKFNRPDSDDPDELLKMCLTLLVAATLEVEKGVENLWKQGESAGMKPYSNYGQFIPKNYFKAFLCGLPFLWCDEKYWKIPKEDLPWDFFLPFVNGYNEKRTELMRVIYLMLDESMSGWRPKTSKTGGLPNISHEPRKPVPLGTMVRNAVECITGIFVHQDIVQGPLGQWAKKYSSPPTKSSLPKGENISYHTAEVLRQAENSKVEKGGWVGGDAWFGSVGSCVELKKVLGIHSTFIVKQNVNYFPMKVLHAVLVARYPQRPAGHWVVMKTTISGVNIFVMAYAWSQKGIAYMVSSCGTTVRHEKNYMSRFEDEFGNVSEKELPRPTVAHFVYEFLPLIDEHNKARQNYLALEKHWLTKCCWTRLVTTFLGMSIVDLQRMDRNRRGEHIDHAIDAEDEHAQDFDIKMMANYVCKPLTSGKFKYRETAQPSTRTTAKDKATKPLARITAEDGSENYPAKNGGRAKPRSMTCYTCCRYMDRGSCTNWWCTACKMPLCQMDRTCAFMQQGCLEEHLASKNKHLGCNGQKWTSFKMPEEQKVCVQTRSSKVKKQTKRAASMITPPKKTQRVREKVWIHFYIDILFDKL
ncbi:hypothetical protein ACHAWF_017536 [Thalassiosira exigua]